MHIHFFKLMFINNKEKLHTYESNLINDNKQL
jgi:hypothetical protein